MQNFKWLLRVAREAVNRWRMKTNQAALQQNLDARSPSAGRSQKSPAAPGTVRRPSPLAGTGMDRRQSPGATSKSVPPASRNLDTQKDQRSPRQKDDRRRSSSPTPTTRKPEVCRKFVRGSCRYGKDCRRSHDLSLTRSRSPSIPGYCNEWVEKEDLQVDGEIWRLQV